MGATLLRATEPGQPLLLKLDQAVGLFWFARQQRQGRVLWLQAPDLVLPRLSRLLGELTQELALPLAALELKVVGCAPELARLKPLLAPLKLTALSVLEKPQGTVLRFFAETGQLQAQVTGREVKGQPANPERIRVMIVDDSVTIRKLLLSIFSSDPGLEVVAATGHPLEVEGLIAKFRPQVITLDIHMPEMDGLTLLKRFHPRFPIPTVLITSIRKEEGLTVLEALEHGAVDYIQKPTLEALDQVAPLMIEKIKIAAAVKSKARAPQKPALVQRLLAPRGLPSEGGLIVMGSSTGGTEALKEILIRLPEQIPPILIVQHIPAVFSLALANRLHSLCPFEVKEAQDGDEVRANRVLLAPGGQQMQLVHAAKGGGRVVRLDDSQAVNRHKPSVDVLFHSVLQAHDPKRVLGVLLTGMGADGAQGLLALKQKGAKTVAQDEASSVVFGMPKVAIGLGAALEVKPLLEIPELLVRWWGSKSG